MIFGLLHHSPVDELEVGANHPMTCRHYPYSYTFICNDSVNMGARNPSGSGALLPLGALITCFSSCVVISSYKTPTLPLVNSGIANVESNLVVK